MHSFDCIHSLAELTEILPYISGKCAMLCDANGTGNAAPGQQRNHAPGLMTDPIPNDATADERATNDERAAWAEVAPSAFGQRTGMVKEKIGDGEDLFLIVADLLADIAHWCDRNSVDLQSALEYAWRHYQTETGGEGTQLRP